MKKRFVEFNNKNKSFVVNMFFLFNNMLANLIKTIILLLSHLSQKQCFNSFFN